MEKTELSVLIVESPNEWVEVVVNDFPSFLQDHANCERKASAMAMSFIAKYPDRQKIIPELMDTAIEELAHFKQVYNLMVELNVALPAEIGQDQYVKKLLDVCRSGRDDRFLDRLLVASIVEYRGAERFRLVHEHITVPALKNFYKNLYLSEARHGEIFVEMTKHYFEEEEIQSRFNFLKNAEGEILLGLPIKPALH